MRDNEVTQVRTLGDDGRRVLEFPRCSLIILNGPRRGHEQVIEADLFRVGKSPENDLTLAEETVSRHHCAIIRDGKGYLLRDLGSTNGTLLDGAEIREAYLKPGAVITVGTIELKVRPFSERIELLPSTADQFGEVVGKALTMREVFGLLERLAPTDATVLIGGETGTGKDVLARSIHAASPRGKGPFIVVDCGAVVGSLIESELFGHEKGAFTGAEKNKRGLFEQAHGATLFLDEIGDMDLAAQAKVLRVLQSGEISRVGSEHTFTVDVRVLAATNKDLEKEVAAGAFREDLFFRLNVFPISVPTLDERKEDIVTLAEAFMKAFCEENGVKPKRIAPDVYAALERRRWPGNVRELKNVVERATILCSGDTITVADLPEDPHVDPFADPVAEVGSGGLSAVGALMIAADGKPLTLKAFREQAERRYIVETLLNNEWNVSRAATVLGVERTNLHKKIRAYGIRRGESD